MVQSTYDHDQLSGVRVLVVEDDALLAMDLEATLVEAGAVVVGLCQTLDEATPPISPWRFSISVSGPKRCRRSRAGWSTEAYRSFSILESRATSRAWPNGGIARSSRSPRRRARWCRP
jgi:hypothetical protein